jgi:hypothetical protein
MRCLSACQAAVLLIERGMPADAQTLVRSATEFLFFAVALLKDPTVADGLKGKDQADKIKQAREMLKDCVLGVDLNAQQVIDLQSIVAGAQPNLLSISAYDAAQIANLKPLYQTFYRGLSLSAAHGTITSANHLFVDGQTGGVTMEFGPASKDIRWSLSLVTKLLEIGLASFSGILALQATS